MEAIKKVIFRQEVKKLIHIKADSTLQSMITDAKKCAAFAGSGVSVQPLAR